MEDIPKPKRTTNPLEPRYDISGQKGYGEIGGSKQVVKNNGCRLRVGGGRQFVLQFEAHPLRRALAHAGDAGQTRDVASLHGRDEVDRVDAAQHRQCQLRPIPLVAISFSKTVSSNEVGKP